MSSKFHQNHNTTFKRVLESSAVGPSKQFKFIVSSTLEKFNRVFAFVTAFVY